MNLATINKIYEKPKLKNKDVVIKKKAVAKSKPKDTTLEIVFNAVESVTGINKREINRATGLSLPCVKRSLDFLLERHEIKRVRVGSVGKAALYDYYTVEETDRRTNQKIITMNNVLIEISKHVEVRKQVLLKRLELNIYALDLALKSLLAKEEIARKFIGMSGGGKIYTYMIKD